MIGPDRAGARCCTERLHRDRLPYQYDKSIRAEAIDKGAEVW